MSLHVWSLYVGAVLALMSTPGPSQLLMLTNSAAHGFRRALATVCGDLTANILQMLAAGLGLAALVAASGSALTVIKWLGVCYLIWLGLRMIAKARPGRHGDHEKPRPASLKTLWMQGFLTSAANPKAVVFFAALFPQFITAQSPFWPQFLILSATYVTLDGLFLSAYGMGSGYISSKFRGPARLWIERAGGGFLITAAILLGLKTIAER